MQRAGPVRVAPDAVVIVLGRDLLPIFKPVGLRGKAEMKVRPCEQRGTGRPELPSYSARQDVGAGP